MRPRSHILIRELWWLVRVGRFIYSLLISEISIMQISFLILIGFPYTNLLKWVFTKNKALPLLFILLCIFLINFIFLDWPIHFYSGRKAWRPGRESGGKVQFYYLISIICCLEHWNITLICSWKKATLNFSYSFHSVISKH